MAFVERKFGPGGAYDPSGGGPWKQGAEIKRTVEPYSEEFVDCLAEIAQYVYVKHGKFPGTLTTLVLPGYVQAYPSTRSSTMPTTSQGRIWRPTPTTCSGGTETEVTDDRALRSCGPSDTVARQVGWRAGERVPQFNHLFSDLLMDEPPLSSNVDHPWPAGAGCLTPGARQGDGADTG
jgi:hypothetical protein